MKERGGYFELERFSGKEYHEDLLRFNYARNAVRYLIRAKHIRRIFLPYYICDSLIKAIKKEDVDILFYHIGPDFCQRENLLLMKVQHYLLLIILAF